MNVKQFELKRCIQFVRRPNTYFIYTFTHVFALAKTDYIIYIHVCIMNFIYIFCRNWRHSYGTQFVYIWFNVCAVVLSLCSGRTGLAEVYYIMYSLQSECELQVVYNFCCKSLICCDNLCAIQITASARTDCCVCVCVRERERERKKERDCMSQSKHRFPAPSSKLCQIWLRH